MRTIHRVSIVAAAILLGPSLAQARNVEAGTVTAAGGVGPAFKLGSMLGGSGASLMLDVQGEYALDRSLGVVAELGFGFPGTIPVRVRAGGRYRLADLELPVSPYGQVQLSYSRLFNVIGANLNVLGARFAVGADYFLTKELGAGAQLGLDLGSTFGDRPAFYGVFEIFVYASYALASI